MTVEGIKEALNARLVVGENILCSEVTTACGADMMSEVLSYVKNQAVLLTGLCNSQVIRTAEMMDITCVIFVRGKKPTAEMISLAAKKEIALLETEYTMFSACGILYEKGIRGGDSVG
jgi:predicted transcriptional regulator